jgi:acetyltransferase-like isoleucine patch superfamily enzyme
MLHDLLLWFCNHIVNIIPIHCLRLLFYRSIMRFSIGKGSSIHLGCKFNSRNNFIMLENSTINQDCRIDNRCTIFIGNNVTISPNCKLITADHDLMDKNFQGREKGISISDFCFMGSDSMILPGCNMAFGSALGAKSLLTKSTTKNKIYLGIPASPALDRFGNYDYSCSYKRWFH